MDQCPLCGESSDQIVNHIINCHHWHSGDSEDQHYLSHHSRPHKCKICKVAFFKMRNLIRHVKRHLRENTTKYSL